MKDLIVMMLEQSVSWLEDILEVVSVTFYTSVKVNTRIVLQHKYELAVL